MRAYFFPLAVGVTLVGCGEAFTIGDGSGGAGSSSSDATTSTSATSTSGSGAGGASSSASSSSSTSTGDGGHIETNCVSPEDCPGADTACSARTCDAGVCGQQFKQAGTVVEEQVPHDCLTTVCDNAGGLQSVVDESDVPEDTPGDCMSWSCAGGEPSYVPNDRDVPNDGQECTTESCSLGSPFTTLAPTGTPCSMGLCDSGAACVSYIPVKCATNAGVFLGCDGQNHLDKIAFIDGFGQDGHCNTSGDVGYCPPGHSCQATTTGGLTLDGTCQ